MTIYCMTCNSIKTETDHICSGLYACSCEDDKSCVKGLAPALECTDIENGFIFSRAIMQDDKKVSLAMVANENRYDLVVISEKERKTICVNVQSIHDAMDITDRLVKEYVY